MKVKWAIIFALVIIAIWLGSGIFVYKTWTNDYGTIGDMFGAINALFAGLAFAGIIYTIAIQRREFDLQRKVIDIQIEEMKMHREEASRSADLQEEQRKLMNFQVILGTVGGMLSVKKELLQSAAISTNYVGKSAFKRVVDLSKMRNSAEINEKRKCFDDYLSAFFDILQYINDCNLDAFQKDELIQIVFINTSSLEYEVLSIYSAKNQHRSALLKSFRFAEKMEARKLSEHGV